MSLKKLALAPDQNSYSLTDGITAISTKLYGGASRLRRDYINAPVLVHVTWTVDENEFDYLRTFYRTTQDGTEPFLMDLLVHGPTMTEHECRIVPKTFKITSVMDKAYRVQAQIEAVPLPPDTDFDEGLVTAFEAFGVEASSAFALLAEIVNVTMPENMG